MGLLHAQPPKAKALMTPPPAQTCISKNLLQVIQGHVKVVNNVEAAGQSCSGCYFHMKLQLFPKSLLESDLSLFWIQTQPLILERAAALCGDNARTLDMPVYNALLGSAQQLLRIQTCLAQCFCTILHIRSVACVS